MVSGQATGVVVGTGDSAEIGHISKMVNTVSHLPKGWGGYWTILVFYAASSSPDVQDVDEAGREHVHGGAVRFTSRFCVMTVLWAMVCMK